MEIDYTKIENRIKAINSLNIDCLFALKDSGMELSEDTLVEVGGTSIEISVRETDPEDARYNKPAFASEVRIYPKDKGITRSSINELSVGSCGSFTPKYRPAYWRIIHAAEVLKNWDAACKVVNTYCKKYDALAKEINAQN